MIAADRQYRAAGELWQLASHASSWGLDEGLPTEDVERFAGIVADSELLNRIEQAKLDALRAGLELPDHVLAPWPVRSICRGEGLGDAERERLRDLADGLYVVALRCRAQADRRRGRRECVRTQRSTEQVQADRRIIQAWMTGQYTTFEALAAEVGVSARDVRRVMDRHRKRELRRAVKG